jgi:glycosyltransferase involved in cell wall biosynthesis
MRTYWSAHGLAARGHEVHVFTNAKEIRPPYRMYMRPEDWERCERSYGAGSVVVHWTAPVDHSQTYIPMASPFVTKLAATAARAHRERRFDVIYAHYLEPYGVAGHLVAQMTGVPQVVRMAGSDAGRLWHHPQFEELYDHVLRSAEAVIAVGKVAERAMARGVVPERVVPGGAFDVSPELFTPEGPRLDLTALRGEFAQDPDTRDLLWGEFAADQLYFGVYGKLGERKGSFALLAALHRLKRSGVDVGLVALAHGAADVEARFRAQAVELGLADRVLQIPFLPHWRVPEFLRGCLAVCCLEQDFPIGVHSPIIPFEVLFSGKCLVGTTEIIRKLPSHWKLPHGYACVGIEDVNDIDVLSKRLAAIARDPQAAAQIGARGRAFACDVQKSMSFVQRLEQILQFAAARQRQPLTVHRLSERAAEAGSARFPLTTLVANAIADADKRPGHPLLILGDRTADLNWAHEVLSAIEGSMIDSTRIASLTQAVQIEIALATAEDAIDGTAAEQIDSIFRLQSKQWTINDDTLADLVVVTHPHLRILEFAFDVAKFLGAQSIEEFPAVAAPRSSHVVTFGRVNGALRNPLLIDVLTARILRLGDGTRTVAEIAEVVGGQGNATGEHVDWIQQLFLLDLVSLRDSPAERIAGRLRPATSPDTHHEGAESGSGRSA